MWRMKCNQADRIDVPQARACSVILFARVASVTEGLKAVGPEGGYRSLPDFRGTRQDTATHIE